MALFTTLLVLIFEHLFKLDEHWQLNHRLEASFRRVKHFPLGHILDMTIIVMGVTFLLLRTSQGVLFNVPTLLVWLLIGLLCIGTGKVHLYYHVYLTAASYSDGHAHATTVGGLIMIHGVPVGYDKREYLHELQNALLWINSHFYPAPLSWLVVRETWGPVTLMGYAFLHARQYWLTQYQTLHHRSQSSIDAAPYILGQVPARPADAVHTLIDHGEKTLPVWFASLDDFHISQYQVLTYLAQFSLARELHVNRVETPKAAVSMTKRTSFTVVAVIVLLTIYGTLV